MSAHTKGPWTAEGETRQVGGWWQCGVRVGEYGSSGTVAPGNVLAIAHLGGPGATSNDRADVEANARLIAAAPDLLDALAELLDYRGGAEHALADEYVVERARAAIAKAEGRS